MKFKFEDGQRLLHTDRHTTPKPLPGQIVIGTSKRVGKGGCRAQFTEIKIENSRFTGIKTDFSRIKHHSAFALIFHPYTPYSKMAAIIVVFVFFFLQISAFCQVLKLEIQKNIFL